MALLVSAWPVTAQVRFGETSSNANGTISTGYTGDYGNLTNSTHNWTLGGTGTLTGSYYSPNFLTYNASFYLNQSRANSDFQSISDASGLNLSTNIFGGSKFPGSVSYSDAYDSEGNYAVPGLANYVTHGNSQTFGINWSENLPAMPSLSAGFQTGTSQYSVYGTSDNGNNAFHSLNLHSNYTLQGFNMGAYYSKGGGHSLIPQIIAGQLSTEINSDNSAYGFNITRKLPLQGAVSGSVNRSEWNSDFLGTTSSGTIDTFNVLASVHPNEKLAFSASANYSDNLNGQLIQSVLNAGGVVSGLNTNQSSDSIDMMAVATYIPQNHVQTSAFAERRTQSFMGQNYGVNSYGGGATYTHNLLDGTFNAALTFAANTSDNTGQDSLGFSTTDNYSSVLFGWHVNASFGYAQNVQTLLVTYMNSYFNYSGNLQRNWGRFNVGGGASEARTGITDQPGTDNTSQSYNAYMGFGSILTTTGSYTKANGQALATGAGLVTVPVPSPTLPSSLVTLFGGDSYSLGVSSSPVRNFIMAATYARANSNTAGVAVTSTNNSNQFNTLFQYQFRKLNYISGYSRLEQGFSGSGTPPQVISSFYVGVSRWFNFF
jgi:hypothetical protein